MIELLNAPYQFQQAHEAKHPKESQDLRVHDHRLPHDLGNQPTGHDGCVDPVPCIQTELSAQNTDFEDHLNGIDDAKEQFQSIEGVLGALPVGCLRTR